MTDETTINQVTGVDLADTDVADMVEGSAAGDSRRPVSRQALEQRRARAIRDLVETQQQLEAGEIDEDTAARLTRIYESEVVAALEGLDAMGPAPDPPAPNRWLRSISGGMILAVVAIALVTIGPLKPRQAGRTVAGDPAANVSTATGAPRDLSTVTNEEMEAVIAKNPAIVGMRLRLVERYISAKELDKALGHVNTALAQNPTQVERAEALRDRGWAIHLQGRSADGAKDLEESLRLVPDNPNAQFWLARVRLEGLRDTAGAITLLEQLVKSQQGDPDALKTVQTLLDQAKAEQAKP